MKPIKVACHSAVYIPWIGYFYKMFLSDIFVILDNTQMLRGRAVGYRNCIDLQGRKHQLSIPIQRRHGAFQRFMDVEIDNTQKWRNKHLQTLRHAYSKHPYYEEIGEWLFPFYEKQPTFLIDFTFAIISRIKEYLGFGNEFRFASEIAPEFEDATERLCALTTACGGDRYISGFGGRDYMNEETFRRYRLDCIIYDFQHPTYPQKGGETFLSNLSVLDLLFNCGQQSSEIIRSSGHAKPHDVCVV